MPLDQVENFVEVNVAGTHSSTETTISLQSGEASNLPDPSGGEFNLVWFDSTNFSRPSEDSEVEIVRVTGRDTNNDTITVLRGQENTTAVAHDTTNSDYVLILAQTAKMIEDVDAANFSTNSVTVAGNSVALGSSTAVDYIDLNDTGSSFPIPNTDLSNSSVSIAGNSVALGGSTPIDHSDLSNINSGDHHIRYTDEEAQDAFGSMLTGQQSLINVTYDDANNEVDFIVQEANIDHDSLANFVANEHIDHSTVNISAGTHLTGGGDITTSRTLNVDESSIDVENLSTQGSGQTVPVSQGDGTIQMQEVSGGLERVSDTEGLVPYKQSFNGIRNRASWIEHILNNEESIADELTSSQVLTHYVFEAENDAYDRFIDPNHNLGLFAYNNDSEPVLSSIYEATMFLAPTSFLEGLMTIESVADTISNSELLMDAVMTGDNVLENQFGKEVTA